MATKTLAENYSNKGVTKTNLLYDPTNGNTEIIEPGIGGRVLFNNGVFTDFGKQIYSSDEQKQILSKAQNDVRAAATTVNGKTQEWAKNPATTDENPSAKGAQPTVIGGIEVPDLGTQIGKDAFVSAHYPETIENGQDRVVITQYEYKRTGIVQTEKDIIKSTEKKILGLVTLPMPNDLSESNSVGWGEDSLTNAAAILMNSATGIASGLAGADAKVVEDKFKDLIGKIQGRGMQDRVNQYLTARAGASLVGKLGINVNPEAYISRATTAAVNPNLELLFNGPKLRQFSLAYKMVARSKKEAVQIRTILRFFKKGMAPRRSTESEGFFLGAPNIFKVDFKSGNSTSSLKSIGQFKTCALVSFSANYTPDGFYAAYDDSDAGGSQPIAVTIQMGFTELTPVFNDEYGDADHDTVGPNYFKGDYNVLNLTESTDGAGNVSTPGNEEAGRQGPPTPGTQTATPAAKPAARPKTPPRNLESLG